MNAIQPLFSSCPLKGSRPASPLAGWQPLSQGSRAAFGPNPARNACGTRACQELLLPQRFAFIPQEQRLLTRPSALHRGTFCRMAPGERGGREAAVTTFKGLLLCPSTPPAPQRRPLPAPLPNYLVSRPPLRRLRGRTQRPRPTAPAAHAIPPPPGPAPGSPSGPTIEEPWRGGERSGGTIELEAARKSPHFRSAVPRGAARQSRFTAARHSVPVQDGGGAAAARSAGAIEAAAAAGSRAAPAGRRGERSGTGVREGLGWEEKENGNEEEEAAAACATAFSSSLVGGGGEAFVCLMGDFMLRSPVAKNIINLVVGFFPHRLLTCCVEALCFVS